jgi:acyl-CoA thioester hydrolase
MGTYIETYRNIVSPAELDHLGHMNVQYYFAAIGGGITSFQIALGLTPSDMRDGRRLAFVVVHGDTNFRAELRAGDVIRLETGVTEVANKTATFHHRMINVEKDILSFETHFKCILMHLETRKAVEIPDDIREKLQAYLV